MLTKEITKLVEVELSKLNSSDQDEAIIMLNLSNIILKAKASGALNSEFYKKEYNKEQNVEKF